MSSYRLGVTLAMLAFIASRYAIHLFFILTVRVAVTLEIVQFTTSRYAIHFEDSYSADSMGKGCKFNTTNSHPLS